jgi:IS30 family transposase
MDMENIAKIALAWELSGQAVPKVHIARELNIGRATVYRWLNGIQQKEGNLEAFIDSYLGTKKGSRQKRKVGGLLKKIIYKIREENKHCCGQKIEYFLKEDYGISLGTTTIYKILGEKYTLRTKWQKNQKRGPVPQATKPREVIQMDTVDFGDIFAFSGIDIFTKEADVVLRPSLTSHDGLIFLETAMKRRFDLFVDLIQTDGGPEFEDEFLTAVVKYTKEHRIARPYKKNEQAFIEAFNRSLRKECLGWVKYQPREIPMLTKEVEDWLNYYHTKRPHLSLGMRPPLD